MTVIVSLLRGVNVGGHHKIGMEALRALYESLELRNPRTYIQSGNVVFLTKEHNLAVISRRIEDAIEKNYGFRVGVVVRNTSELSDIVSRNPFAERRGIDPSKLLVIFLPTDPSTDTREELHRLKPSPEEIRAEGREVYVYFPDGIGRSKLLPVLERILKKSGTGRNFNTVTKLLEMAKALERSR